MLKKIKGLDMATLVTISNPRLPGSVVGEQSIHPREFVSKVTSVRMGHAVPDMYLSACPCSPARFAPPHWPKGQFSGLYCLGKKQGLR